MNEIKQQRSWVEIDLSAFSDNVRCLQGLLLSHQSFMQVVKADGYGHSAYQIAKVAIECGAVMLGVANVEEAIHLRFQKIDLPILILSPSLESEIELIVEYDIIPSVSEMAFCERLNAVAGEQGKSVPVHLKIDTGMNRNGVKAMDLVIFLKDFCRFEHLRIEGLFSHFAASDDDAEFTSEQYDLFLSCVEMFKSSEFSRINHSLKYVHISNSGGVLRREESRVKSDERCNLVRLGLATYGYATGCKLNITPVMSFKSRISHINIAYNGESIGYNRTFVADKYIKYAIVPVGYADGYDFLLSNKAKVLIKETECAVLGRVSMDMICVDVSAVPDVCLNDEVVLLGRCGRSIVDANTLAGHYGGSVYELLCQLGRRAKRFYFYKGKLIDDEPLQRRAFIPKDFSSGKLTTIIKQAIAHRIKSDELSSVIYQDILKYFFADSDREVAYRSGFRYDIKFSESELSDYYKVSATISFNKVLQNDSFTIACANDNHKLQSFFREKICEYRWLLDKNLALTTDMFNIKQVCVNEHSLLPDVKIVNDCLVYQFSDAFLSGLREQEVKFYIEIETLYPRSSHQFAVYINEITKGVEVNFTYPVRLFDVETTQLFSGRERFPEIVLSGDAANRTVSVKSSAETWVFPTSGIVFSLNTKESL